MPPTSSTGLQQGTISAQNSNVNTGVPTANSTVSLNLQGNYDTLTIQVTGSYTGPLSVQVNADGNRWETLTGINAILNVVTGISSNTIASGAVGVYQVDAAALQGIRVTALGAVTGAATVTLIGGVGGNGSGGGNSGGGSASGAAPSGNPLRTGGIARDVGTKQTRADGTTADNITDLNENSWMREAYAPLYEDNVAGVAKTEQRYTSYALNSAGTFTIKSGAGYIQTISILGGTLGAITVYDNTAGSGTAILPTFTPTASLPAPSIDVYAVFNTGLTIVTAAATLIQISYR